MLIKGLNYQEESNKTMSINYKMIHRGDYMNPDEKKKSGYYPQIIRSKTVNLEEMATTIAKGKRLQAFEIKGTLELLMACIEDELLNGNNVCLDGFGTFALSATCSKHVENPNDVRAESIAIKRVTFKPSKPLIKRMKEAKFKRSS